MKTKTLIYEIDLIDFIKIYDISGMQNMMKQIIVQGEGLVKPFENNYISINYKIYLNNILFKEKQEHFEYLNEENFTESEIIILKSMKKNELSRIDIQYLYFVESFLDKSKLFSKNEFDYFIENTIKNKEKSNNSENLYHMESPIQEKIEEYYLKEEEEQHQKQQGEQFKEKDGNQSRQNKENKINKKSYKEDCKVRITYEIELVKLKNNKSFNSYKNITYEKSTLCKGIGNVCPWDRSLLKFLMRIKINDKEIYCDDFKELKVNKIEFSKKIKDIKRIIKTKNNYLKNTQIVIDSLIKDKILIDTEIYDPLLKNLPEIFFEVLKSMRLLQIENLKFTIEKQRLKNEFIKLKNKNIDFKKDEEFKNKDLTFDVTLCLINFQENFSIFNKNIIILDEEAKYKRLIEYKNEANFYFNNWQLNKSKKINKFLVNEYTKYINVDNSKTSDLLVRNKDDFIKPELKFEFMKMEENECPIKKDQMKSERNFYYEMKKIFSNLILVYFKLEKVKKCQEYIDLFYHIFIHEFSLRLTNAGENNKQNVFTLDEIYEKVLLVEFKLKLKLLELNQSEILINRLISFYHLEMNLEKKPVFEFPSNIIIENKESVISRYNNHTKEFQNLKDKIKKTENDKNNLFKKMFKY